MSRFWNQKRSSSSSTFFSTWCFQSSSRAQASSRPSSFSATSVISSTSRSSLAASFSASCARPVADQPLQRPLEHVLDLGDQGRAAGRQRARRERAGARDPAALPVLVDDDVVARLEGRVPRRQRRLGRAPELLVALLHRVERVVVEAEPDVQAVLEDAVGHRALAAARALAAEPPAGLVDGDLVAVAQLGRGGQLERGRDRRRPAAEHRDPFPHGSIAPSNSANRAPCGSATSAIAPAPVLSGPLTTLPPASRTASVASAQLPTVVK